MFRNQFAERMRESVSWTAGGCGHYLWTVLSPAPDSFSRDFHAAAISDAVKFVKDQEQNIVRQVLHED